MKRKVLLFAVFLLFLTLFSVSVSAELNTTQINKGYSCLQNKTANCSTSLDDNIFTLLSAKTCKSQVMLASSNDECWPTGACKIKQTAQALFALKESGARASTVKPKAWLLAHTKAATNLEWYLQIDAEEITTCTITYSVGSAERSYQISIGTDKKINDGAGSCLSLSETGYWLKIAPQCQSNEYKISCDKDFVTNSLFKEQSSPTIHVGAKINSASSGGTTTEKINSSCFADGQGCSYEGTLWASLVLDSLNEDISSYIPYLVTAADNNPKSFPEAFLYILSGESYRNDLLLKQKNSQYWETSGDRYYDTALALFALRYDEETEKTNALNWVETTQGSDGCWQGSIKNTAFLLYAISPRAGTAGSSNGSTSNPDCETANYFCMSSSSCTAAGGNALSAYSCSFGVCCSKEKELSTCDLQGGEICSSSERCLGGRFEQSSDNSLGRCCVGGGECIVADDDNGGGNGGGDSECEINLGFCRSFSCTSNETINNNFSCDLSSEVCCFDKLKSKNYTWIWVLVALIILLIVAIIFRDSLRRFWLYIKTKFKPSGPSSGGAYNNQSYFGSSIPRMMPRRILPHTGAQHHGPVPQRRHSGELDDVLKKLKDISK